MARYLTVLLAVVGVVTLGACSTQEPEVTVDDQVPGNQQAQGPESSLGSATVQEEPVEFVSTDFAFPEAPETLTAGEVTFELVNEGGVVHNVAIEELDDVVVVEAQPGQREVGPIDLPPGTYTYYCAIPGHRELGMEGTVLVN